MVRSPDRVPAIEEEVVESKSYAADARKVTRVVECRDRRVWMLHIPIDIRRDEH